MENESFSFITISSNFECPCFFSISFLYKTNCNNNCIRNDILCCYFIQMNEYIPNHIDEDKLF